MTPPAEPRRDDGGRPGPETRARSGSTRRRSALAANGVFGNCGAQHPARAGLAVGRDMSLQRRFRVSDRSGVTLRWDVFNLFNHPNFGFPDTNLSNTTTVGSITSLGGDARLMQFALRVDF